MADRHAELLFDGSFVEVYDVRCSAPCSGYGDEEWNSSALIVLPQRGVFVVRLGREPVVVDETTAIVFGRDLEYRDGHPVDGGDDCTVLLVTPELLEQALGDDGARYGVLRARTLAGARFLTVALRRGLVDPLEAEEASLLLLDALAADLLARAAVQTRLAGANRTRVEHVRALLSSSPTKSWRLDEVARAVHCSPFHLARQFRLVTGETIGRYLTRLRLSLALHRLSEGETDLARLALDAGFAHHSHFSARFRAGFGMTPTAAREALANGGFAELRKIVIAGEQQPP